MYNIIYLLVSIFLDEWNKKSNWKIRLQKLKSYIIVKLTLK